VDLVTIAPGWGSGFTVRGGQGPTRTDLADLTHAVQALETAARRLDDASTALGDARRVAVGHLLQRTTEASAAVDALTSTLAAAGSPARVADELRDLARRLRDVVQGYEAAESWVHHLVRSLVEAEGTIAASSPFGGIPMLLGGAVMARDHVVLHGVLAALRTHDLTEMPGAFLRDLTDAPDRLRADGRAELAVDALAQYLLALGGRLGLPAQDAVPAVARTIARALPPAGPTAVLARDHPPQLDAPRDPAGLLRNVARSYAAGHGGEPGTPAGTITVQRLDHPDGSRSWAVEIPGTQTAGLNADVPTDATTNLRLMAGLPDDMSTAVVEAMRQAGIPPDEPVALTGHSQGGMVAMKVAALTVGLFDVRAVVTAGSPDIPGRIPPGVAALHVRHGQDLVPQVDGSPDEPSADAVVLEHRLPATDHGGQPGISQAHAVTAYVETVDDAWTALDGQPALRAFDRELADVLGPDGTTAVTLQFQATRDPDLVRTDPATGLPRPGTIRPVPQPVAP
jgi:hypothetical protein